MRYSRVRTVTTVGLKVLDVLVELDIDSRQSSRKWILQV